MKISKVTQHVSVNGNDVSLHQGNSYNDVITGLYPNLFIEVDNIEEVLQDADKVEKLLIEAPVVVNTEVVIEDEDVEATEVQQIEVKPRGRPKK